jgi:DNA polymerase-1
MPDYSQIEVWVFAFVANERRMKEALLRGSDFHLNTADSAWGHRKNFCTCGRWKEVRQEMRRNKSFVIVWDAEKSLHKKGCLIKWWRQRAKMILFSRLYGGGVGKIAFLIRCSEDEAVEFIDEFNDNLPGVKTYMDSLVEEVRESGRLINLFGREYPIERERAYKAVNYMIQGSCSEIMKRALVRIDRYLSAEFPRSYVVGSVHDEAIQEIHVEDHSRQLMRSIVALMQKDSHYVPNLTRPLPVGMKITRTNWSEAKEVNLSKFILKRAA